MSEVEKYSLNSEAIKIYEAYSLWGTKLQTQNHKEKGIPTRKGKCPVCRYNAAPVWLNIFITKPDAYDVTCPKCKSELLIYNINDKIYLKAKPSYF